MAVSPSRAYVGLGSNLDDPRRHVESALQALDRLPGTRLVGRSSLHRTAPVGYSDQPDFVNAAAAVETTLAPRELLVALLGIEAAHGRRRSFRNAPRTLDLDLLVHEAVPHCDEPGLTLPHPRMHERAFVLLPLAQIAPGLVIPGQGRVDALVAAMDVGGVVRLDD